MNPLADTRPFLREDGSFRFLSSAEFAELPLLQKVEYLNRVSKELQKSQDELRTLILKRDRESDN